MEAGRQADTPLRESGETTLSIEREKIELERERLVLERERLENERLRHRETVELANRAAGRVVVPASSFSLFLLAALLVGGALGAWVGATWLRPSPASIAATVARAIGSRIDDDTGGTNDFPSAYGPVFRAAGRNARGAGYLLILD